MGPIGIELSDELIKAGLLLEAIGAGGSDGFLFQSEVHALVTAVLLWAAWFNAFDVDTEAQPPDGELREIEEGVWAGEGNAVIGADGIG